MFSGIAAILLATIISFFMGGLWFMLLFKKPFMAAMGRTEASHGMFYLIGPSLCNLVSIATSLFLMRKFEINNLPDIMAFSLIIGVGYIGATIVNAGINPNMKSPMMYGVICAPYFILSTVISNVILFYVA